MNYIERTKESVKEVKILLNGNYYSEDDFIDCCKDLVMLFSEIPYFEVIIHDSNVDLNEIVTLVELSCGVNLREVGVLLDFHKKVLGDYGIEFKQLFKYCLENSMLEQYS